VTGSFTLRRGPRRPLADAPLRPSTHAGYITCTTTRTTGYPHILRALTHHTGKVEKRPHCMRRAGASDINTKWRRRRVTVSCCRSTQLPRTKRTCQMSHVRSYPAGCTDPETWAWMAEAWHRPAVTPRAAPPQQISLRKNAPSPPLAPARPHPLTTGGYQTEKDAAASTTAAAGQRRWKHGKPTIGGAAAPAARARLQRRTGNRGEPRTSRPVPQPVRAGGGATGKTDEQAGTACPRGAVVARPHCHCRPSDRLAAR